MDAEWKRCQWAKGLEEEEPETQAQLYSYYGSVLTMETQAQLYTYYGRLTVGLRTMRVLTMSVLTQAQHATRGAPRPGLPAGEVSAGSGVISSGWSCLDCTLDNAHAALVCAVCGAP